jgi:hypothetical protein
MRLHADAGLLGRPAAPIGGGSTNPLYLRTNIDVRPCFSTRTAIAHEKSERSFTRVSSSFVFVIRAAV